MKKATKRPRGIQWAFTTRLEDLDFADNNCLIFQNSTDMAAKLKYVEKYAGQVGLKINVS